LKAAYSYDSIRGSKLGISGKEYFTVSPLKGVKSPQRDAEHIAKNEAKKATGAIIKE
jgi:hypothetical protein